MRNTSLQQLIQRNRLATAFKSSASAGLVALMLAGASAALTGCDANLPNIGTNGTTTNNRHPATTEQIINGTTINDDTITTEDTIAGNNGNQNIFIPTSEFGSGDIYWHLNNERLHGAVLAKIDSAIYKDVPNDDFSYAAAPLNFLIEQGILYRDQNGVVRQTNPSNGITCHTWLKRDCMDTHSVYISVHYTSGDVEYAKDNSNTGTYKVTWVLRYDLNEKDFRDFYTLFQKHDFTTRFFIQQMDRHYTRNIVDKSITDYYTYCKMEHLIFDGGAELPYNSNCYFTVDYDNMTLTVYDFMRNNTKKWIETYTIDIRETKAWGLKGNSNKYATDQEWITSHCYLTPYGYAYNSRSLDGGWTIKPTDEQLANKTVVCDEIDEKFASSLTIDATAEDLDRYYSQAFGKEEELTQ